VSSPILQVPVLEAAAATVGCALALCILLVLTKSRHGRFTFDSSCGIQKFHVQPTPRVGGIAIYCGLLLGWALIPGREAQRILGVILLAGVPAFACGLIEDITKNVGVVPRLLATMTSGFAACLLTGVALNRVELPGLEAFVAGPALALLFTVFAIGGVANAINIVDGFHGLASGIGIIALSSLATIAACVGDRALVVACLLVAAAVVGFWVVNFPWGKLFMGDGGAYFVGFALAWLAVLLPMRNPQVSVWAALLVCAYPVTEVLYSVARRYLERRSPGEPDDAHMHSLIKSGLSLQNAAVSPIVWLFAAAPAVAAIPMFDQTVLLACAYAASVVLYHLSYRLLHRRIATSEAGRRKQKTIAIIGTVGVPAAYGGFETLAENLVTERRARKLSSRLIVYCSARNYSVRPKTYMGAELRYVPLSANGPSSVAYDIASLLSALWHGCDVILLLGVSGAIALPLVRFVSRVRIVTNIDGVEWRRAKWKGFSRWFLRVSERIAVGWSHEVIADNPAIAAHVREAYGRACHVIAYGGDHAVEVNAKPCTGLPTRYMLALCRIEPENNPEMILEAFAARPELDLVFIGNWDGSAFARNLRRRFACHAHLHLLDPIYDSAVLRTIRSGASLYIHGHSAGGTNPSLVEIMHFGIPVLAFDCVYNREATDNAAVFFKNPVSLRAAADSMTAARGVVVGANLQRIARQRYTWGAVATEYFMLLDEAFANAESALRDRLHTTPEPRVRAL
jgi:UDP-N-acetylmuramyl pentapeptide phosphotransferase/UDP-N-acetylglucosamine-1-phosphate transferase/glycosyltransferase involved in cell wall biosynthesis